jgi:chemotaxis protein methyltransferase CheR
VTALGGERDGDLVWRRLLEDFRRWTGMELPLAVQPIALPAIEARRRATRAHSALDYLARLERDLDERQRLIDDIPLGMTWFFRERAGLEALADALHFEPSGGGREVTIWCIGCSTGEEPYSLAMLLLEAGLTPRILATDINRSLLRRGFEGRYAARDVDELPVAWRMRHFARDAADRVKVTGAARAAVEFEHHNVSLSAPPRGWPAFDAVVCRNVLLFFRPADAVVILRRLAQRCRPGGHLLLGALDRPLLGQVGGVWRRDDGSPLAQVTEPGSPARPPRANERDFLSHGGRTGIATSGLAHGRTTEAPAPRPPSAVPIASRARRPTVAEPVPAVLLDRLERLEAEGDLATAGEVLDQALRRHPLAGALHLLRGLLHKRAGDLGRATDSLRTARFLDQESWMAPYQLALCLEARGERRDAAEAFRHALLVLQSGGRSGLPREHEMIASLARTVVDTCRRRLGGLTDRAG